MSARPRSLEDPLDRLDVLLAARVRGVDQVEEQVAVVHLFERRAEGGEQVLRQVADEADRVGDDDLAARAASAGGASVGSSVANSLSSASTSRSVSVLSSVLLPAFV